MAKENKNDDDDDDDFIAKPPKLINLPTNNMFIPFHRAQKSNQWGSKPELELKAISGTMSLSSASVRRNYNNFNQCISKQISAINRKSTSNKTMKNNINAANLAKPKKKKQALRYQGTDNDLELALLGINFDSKFGVDDEEEDIAKLDFEFARSLLTVSRLEETLIDQPAVVHVSTHGSHHYKALNAENEFQISFEETHVFRALLDGKLIKNDDGKMVYVDANYSAYYAVIALLFEMEINHFVQYGEKYAAKHNKGRFAAKLYMWCDETRFALLTNKKMYGLFGTILDRFGMHYEHNRNAKCIEIYWGKYEYDRHSSTPHIPRFIAPPHAPMDVYQLKTLYQDDEDVQEILREINEDYNRSLQHNVKIAKSLRKHQKFSWEILSILLHRKLMDKGAEPEYVDDTQWIVEEKEDTQHKLPLVDEEKDPEDDIDPDDYAAFFGSDSDDGDKLIKFGVDIDDDDNKMTAGEPDDFEEDNSFYDDENDEDRLTKCKFGKIMDLIREVKVIPIIKVNKADETMPQLIERVSQFKSRLVKSIKKIPDIQIQLSQKSRNASNVHIIQFANKYALTEAKKKVDKIRSNSKYNHDYDIQFRHISKADEETKKQVGFVKKMQEKVYRIDVVNKRDPISLMLRKHLKNKEECKIKLLVLNGCHSFILGKIFSEYVKNVICIHPFVKIWDSTAIKFTRHFYNSLQDCTNPSTPFELSVLKSYNDAKINVAKECPNDNECESHSHSHPRLRHKQHRRMRHKQQQFNQLHLSENWNELQNHINDPIKFKQYRLKMQKSGASIIDDELGDIYDDCTLILSNLSAQTMIELKEYLEDLKPKKIDNKYEIEDDELFVEKWRYQTNEHYEELSVAYFKFKTIAHRREAIKLLKKKQREEKLLFSDYIRRHADDSIHDKKEWRNLGWNHRVVPRCCCSPHHPHCAQDKLILLQDGHIINRNYIRDLRVLRKGLLELRIRTQERQERKDETDAKLPDLSENATDLSENGADSSKLSSCSDEIDIFEAHTNQTKLSIKISSSPRTKKKKKENKFGDDDDDERTKNNATFKNDLYFKQSAPRVAKQNDFSSPIATTAKRMSATNSFNSPVATKRLSGKNKFGDFGTRTHKKKNTFDFSDDDIDNKLLPQNKPKNKNTFLQNNDTRDKKSNNIQIRNKLSKKRINKF